MKEQSTSEQPASEICPRCERRYGVGTPCACLPESTMTLCECVHWAHADARLNYLTNHHENCPHYNDSLIDVWEVTDGAVTCVFDNEKGAQECFAADTESGVEGLRIGKKQMHREVFENFGEFEGF